ncbi:MAG: hypothetical protein NTZ83_02295 [Candidatus Pacearchaeota archaeon]|nr:hypothetical protein [Candidatus Pacearchaeota archaeon]
MAKTVVPNIDRRNFVSLYIREEEKPIFNRFMHYIQKDERLLRLRLGEKKGIMSVAIMQLILGYVNKIENGEVPGISQSFIEQVCTQIPAGEEITS